MPAFFLANVTAIGVVRSRHGEERREVELDRAAGVASRLDFVPMHALGGRATRRGRIFGPNDWVAAATLMFTKDWAAE